MSLSLSLSALWSRPATPAADAGLLTLGGVPIPASNETVHFLLLGSTGTGKTTALDELLGAAHARGDRLIVVDPNGHHLSRLWQDGDAVLNPFDTRFPGWSLFNELRTTFDCDRLARSLIPGGHGQEAQWNFYAQILVSEVLRKLRQRGETDTGSLLHWLTMVDAEALAELLAGTPAAGLFDREAGRALASTRFIITTRLNAHKHVPPGDFSLRTWLDTGRGNLFITWREDMQAALLPLITCWTDILANALLSLPEDATRRIWLSLDELGALGELPSLTGVLTRGRKVGAICVAGLQSVAQTRRIYGADNATVLHSCFRNLLVLGQARSDPDTADFASRALGEVELERAQRTANTGPAGLSIQHSAQRVQTRLVLPSELAGLPALTAYLALAGESVVREITLTPNSLPQIAAAIEEATC